MTWPSPLPARHTTKTCGLIWIIVVVKIISGFMFILNSDGLFEAKVKMER